MPSLRVAAFLFAALLLTNPLAGQDGKKKDDPKADEPVARYKGQLPPNWKRLGLTDDQTQKVYKVQGKYNQQIERLKEQIEELKGKLAKERYEILTAEQKKRLEDLAKAKAGG